MASFSPACTLKSFYMSMQLSLSLHQAQCARLEPVQRQAPRLKRRALGVVPKCTVSTSCDLTEAIIEEKQSWQSNVRALQGRRKHRMWEPVLQDPPPLLDDVCVVLVSPKRPISVGTVARSCCAFECEDLRIVQPRCDHLARSSRNGSKGAQFLLWRAQQHDSLQSALEGVEVSIACTRWVAGRPNSHRSIAELLAAPQIAQLLATLPGSSGRGSGSGSSSSSMEPPAAEQLEGEQPPQQLQRRQAKLALVFGREVEGLTAAEVDACDMTLSIPIGRLQESLSLSHAVSVVLSRLFELRQQASGYELPQGVEDLAAGYQDSGAER